MFQVCETPRHQVILVSSHQKRLEDNNAWRLYCPDAVSVSSRAVNQLKKVNIYLLVF